MMTNLRDRCLNHLQMLGIPLRPDTLDAALSKADKESLSHLSFLDQLLGPPAAARHERAVERRIREARFAEPKTLEGFDWKFNPKAFDRAQIEELASGDFIRRRTNLIFVGWRGGGKSHIPRGRGRQPCAAVSRSFYRPPPPLLATRPPPRGKKPP